MFYINPSEHHGNSGSSYILTSKVSSDKKGKKTFPGFYDSFSVTSSDSITPCYCIVDAGTQSDGGENDSVIYFVTNDNNNSSYSLCGASL